MSQWRVVAALQPDEEEQLLLSRLVVLAVAAGVAVQQ